MAEGKPPRAGSMGDVERTFLGRTKTNPRIDTSIPVEIDPELTPPPGLPPEHLDQLSVEDQLTVLRSGAKEHAEAIGRVWDARNLNENVVGIGKDVAELGALMREFMMPAVKTLLGRVDSIERANSASAARQDRFWAHEWPSALKTLDTIGQHMGRMEKDVDRVERNLDAYIKRADEQRASDHAKLIELKASDERTEARIRVLEDFALTVKAKVAVVSALIGGGGAGLALVIKDLLG